VRRRAARGPWPLLLGVLVAAGIAGAVLAAVLTGGGGNEKAAAPPPGEKTVVKTITQQGTTVHETVTAPAPAPTTQSQTTTAAVGGDPHALNDRGYALMRQGDYEAALPLLKQAVQGLQGVGPSDPYEGYANYNLGYTLLQLGHCSEAVPYLERAKQLEPERHEPKDALKRARKC
jgi:tetratricopeptide (TPR) repeat protein